MGDIWPYGPPHRYPQAQITYQFSVIPGVTPDPNIMGAICMAESGGDVAVVNDTPATGDFSVGMAQINYYGYLYASRAAEFGTPAQLVAGGLVRQASAAVVIWRQQGYRAWSTYTSGAYRRYYGAPAAAGTPQAPGQRTKPVNVNIAPPTEDYSAWVRAHANQLVSVSRPFASAAAALAAIKDTNPHG